MRGDIKHRDTEAQQQRQRQREERERERGGASGAAKSFSATFFSFVRSFVRADRGLAVSRERGREEKKEA